MAEFKISSLNTTELEGKGTKQNPFILSQGEGLNDVTTIDLDNCYVQVDFGSMPEPSKLQSIKGGFITNTDLMDTFAFCEELTEFDCHLDNLIYGFKAFAGTNLESFTTDLRKLENGHGMFANCTRLASFTSNLSRLSDAEEMFLNCFSLTEFSIDLSNLFNGHRMFGRCSSLQTFTSELRDLRDGRGMFNSCSLLQTFTSDLSNLTDGSEMFDNCSSLQSFTNNLGALIDGCDMFAGCSSLQSFDAVLKHLEQATTMFANCSSLQEFEGDLCNVHECHDMFLHCDSLNLVKIICTERNVEIFNKETLALNEETMLLLSTDNGQTWFEPKDTTTKLQFTLIGDDTKYDIPNIMEFDEQQDFFYYQEVNGAQNDMPSYGITVNHRKDRSEFETIDALYFNNCNIQFEDTSALRYCRNLSTLKGGDIYLQTPRMYDILPSLTTCECNMERITNGNGLFSSPNLMYCKCDMRNVGNCDQMFAGCSSLISFEGDLSRMYSGMYMFDNCQSLQSVKIKCTEDNKRFMTKSILSIRQEATLEVSTDGGENWETINN